MMKTIIVVSIGPTNLYILIKGEHVYQRISFMILWKLWYDLYIQNKHIFNSILQKNVSYSSSHALEKGMMI